jgi:hypothetical protein
VWHSKQGANQVSKSAKVEKAAADKKQGNKVEKVAAGKKQGNEVEKAAAGKKQVSKSRKSSSRQEARQVRTRQGRHCQGQLSSQS